MLELEMDDTQRDCRVSEWARDGSGNARDKSLKLHSHSRRNLWIKEPEGAEAVGGGTVQVQVICPENGDC